MILKFLWYFFFGIFGRLVPFSWCRALAFPVSRIAWLFGIRKRITLQNLSLAFPDLTDPQRTRLALKAYRNICTTFLELPVLRYMNQSRCQQYFCFENVELLQTIGEHGALLLSGHVGNWEMLAVAAGCYTNKPISVIVKRQRDYGLLDTVRTRFGNKTVETSQAARNASVMLKSGGVIAMLADQSAGPEDHSVTFFGIPTYTFSAPARLALRYRPRVIIGFAIPNEQGGYSAHLTELPHDDLPDSPDGAIAFSQRYADRLEQVIRSHPDLWLWTHRKWKHSSGVKY